MDTKKMRLLATVLVIALFSVSWYTMISDAAEEDAKYNAYLNAARVKRERNLVEDARDYYLATLQLRDSIELRKEIAEFYKETADAETYVEYCKEVMEDYPYEVSIYEILCNYYKEKGGYASCYSIIKMARKRGLESELLSTTAIELAYKYQLRNIGVSEVTAFSEGGCAVLRHDGVWGYVNGAGATVIPFQYSKASPIGSGLAGVWTQEGEFLLVNLKNRPKSKDAHNRTIEDCTMLASGLIALKYDGKYHYCNADLEEVFGAYDYAGAFSNNVAVVMSDGKWDIIDTTGKVISKQSFEEIKVDALGVAFRNERAFAKKNGSYIMIDTQGNQIGNTAWEDVDIFNSNQPAAVKKDGKWGYVDTSGKLVCEYKFSNARSFAQNMAPIEENGMWGYIDADYEIKIEPAFSDAMDFASAGTAIIKKDGKWRLLRIYSLT